MVSLIPVECQQKTTSLPIHVFFSVVKLSYLFKLDLDFRKCSHSFSFPILPIPAVFTRSSPGNVPTAIPASQGTDSSTEGLAHVLFMARPHSGCRGDYFSAGNSQS